MRLVQSLTGLDGVPVRIAEGLGDELVGRSPNAYMDPAKFKTYCYELVKYIRDPKYPSREGVNVLWLDAHYSHLNHEDALDGLQYLRDNDIWPDFIPSTVPVA